MNWNDPASVTRFIREEIKRQLQGTITNGTTGTTDAKTEGVEDLFPGMATIPSRPVTQPYGISSRAPAKSVSVVGRMGDHPGARTVLGHWDKNKPTNLAEGETSVYSKDKYEIRVLNGKVEIGKNGVYEPAVLGDKLTAALIAILQQIELHYHIGNLGFPTGYPVNQGNFQSIRTGQIEGDKLLVKDGGGF